MNSRFEFRSTTRLATAVASLVLIVSLLFAPALAGSYFELGFEGGGDTLASTSLEDLNAAGGFRLAFGLQRFIGGFEDVGLLFSVGYLFDRIDGSNGDAEIDAFLAEFIYFRDFGPHRLGIGGSYHLNPEYKDDVDGFAKTRIKFDDAPGVVVRYAYILEQTFEFGARYTLMDYKVNGSSFDADSLGIFLSVGF